MATRGAQTYLSPEEYITLERKAVPDEDTIRSEYLDGEIISMSGASRVHNLITLNFAAELRTQLRGSGCEVYASEMRVSFPLTTSYFYPDIVVVCDEPDFEDEVFDTLLNPIILIEVLSLSTEVYDKGEKFSHYRQLESLKEYIVVSQDKVNIERFIRKPDGWSVTYFQDLEQLLPITAIQCELSLTEIYDRVTFTE